MSLRVVVFGATGMLGHAALLECLDDPDVAEVLSVGRSPAPVRHAKLTDLVTPDLYDLEPWSAQLTGFDACLFCLGVSSAGMKEDDYRRVTYDLTLAAGTLLAELDPGMAFLYISGAGTDSSERGRVRWARVKGATENALAALPLTSYALRPGFIRARRGVRPRNKVYARLYAALAWVGPLARRFAPSSIIDSDELGRAMLTIAKTRPEQQVWPTADLVRLGRRSA